MGVVFREVLPARLAPLPSTLFSRIDYWSSKPPQTPSWPKNRRSGDKAQRGAARLQNRLYTHRVQATSPLVADRGSNLLPTSCAGVLASCRVSEPPSGRLVRCQAF